MRVSLRSNMEVILKGEGVSQQNISDALRKLGLSRKKTMIAKLARVAEIQDEQGNQQGNVENVVVQPD